MATNHYPRYLSAPLNDSDPAMTRLPSAIALMLGLTMLLPSATIAGGATYERTYPLLINPTSHEATAFYAEFRGRNEASGFGHSYIVLGIVDSTGETRQTVVAGFLPRSADDDRWSKIGVPVTGLVGVARSDFTRRPDVRFRIALSRARYYRVVAKVYDLSRTWTTYELLLRNCNNFVSEVADEAGLRTPILTAQLPVWYIGELRALNSHNP